MDASKSANRIDDTVVVLEQLVRLAIQGDRQALYDLCRRIAKGVLFRVKYHMQGSQSQDAEDVAQETLIRVCENIHALKNPKALSAWLNSIILNEVRRQGAQNVKHAGHVLYLNDYAADAEEENTEFLPQEYALREEEYGVVMEMVNALPDRQREAVLFYYYEHLSVIDTAKIMGIPQPSVSLYLKLAREKVKDGLLARAERAEDAGSNRLRAIAGLPVGSILAQTLHREEGLFSAAGDAWAEKVAGHYARQIQGRQTKQTASQTASSSKTRILGGLAIGAAAVVIAVSAFATTSGPAGGVVSDKDALSQLPPEAHPRVVFTQNSEYDFLNPAGATYEIDEAADGLTALRWAITASGSEEVLYSGEGGVVGEPLAGMSGRGEDGEYLLTFTLEDEEKRLYKLSRGFQILSDLGG